ncbi:hypothetical protein BDV3_006942 [Batrachochytrium dendrobatidis]
MIAAYPFVDQSYKRMFDLGCTGKGELVTQLVDELHSHSNEIALDWSSLKLSTISYTFNSNKATSLALSICQPLLKDQPLTLALFQRIQDSFAHPINPQHESTDVLNNIKGSELYAITLISTDGLSLGIIVQVLSSIASLKKKHHVCSIKTLSDPDKEPATAIDVIVRIESAASKNSAEVLSALRSIMYQLGSSHRIDITAQFENVFRRHKRLFVFDMDSTLIQQEVIDEIARHAGIVDQVSRITESAMRGEIDFRDSLQQRVLLLKGHPASILDEIRSSIVFSPGVKDLCVALKRLGCKLAVISGGFLPLARYVQAELRLDYAFANNLKVTDDGKHFAGSTSGPVVDASRKAELLTVIAQAELIDHMDQVVAVGDGANDLQMMTAAGLGIAYNAKPKVQQQADARINQPSMLHVLYLMGLQWKEIQDLLQMN